MLKRMIQSILVIAILATAIACSSAPSGAPDAEKIKGDLIGQSIGNLFGRAWVFESLSEFERFKITDTTSSGNIVEYKANAGLKDMRTGKRYSTDLMIQYRKEGAEWKLIRVTDNNSFKEVN